MIERGVDVSYETIRQWVDKFGSIYAKRIKTRSEKPSTVWHLDEVYTNINGKMVYLWQAVDDEGTVLDVVVQRRRNTKAAMRLLRKLLRNQGVKPKRIVTDRLGSYGAAFKLLRRRERKAQKFRSMHNAQKLLSVHSQIYNLFNHRRHLISRNTLRKFRVQAICAMCADVRHFIFAAIS